MGWGEECHFVLLRLHTRQLVQDPEPRPVARRGDRNRKDEVAVGAQRVAKPVNMNIAELAPVHNK